MISLLHRLVAIPAVYELAQRLVGSQQSAARFTAALARLPAGTRVLDVGAGTGLARKCLPPGCSYTACEPDPQKCVRLLEVCPEEAVMRASAAAIPSADASFDACLLSAVTHHLTDGDLKTAVHEIRRVLVPHGTFFLLDALWAPKSLRGRFLWAVDRGSHPRTLSQIVQSLQECFVIDETILWSIHHHYALLVCRPKSEATESHSTGAQKRVRAHGA
jgi:ubiquinone/menaquinone biosynthesis C-methylase UbiE